MTKHQGPNKQKFLEQEAQNDQVRTQMAAQKKDKKNIDGMKQPQLFSRGGVMTIKTVYDPAMQQKFDVACVDFCAETFTSFNVMESINMSIHAYI